MQRIENDNDILVSVGIPVRNGGEIFNFALNSVLQQTHKNLEIIISNNNSTDSTEEVCLKAAARDPRIKYFKHEKSISALENFRFVFEQSQGRYFMWAAHDDLRTENYVEVLLSGFQEYSDASIVFSEMYFFYDDAIEFSNSGRISQINLSKQKPLSYGQDVGCLIYENKGLGWQKKHLKLLNSTCSIIYGLINSKWLKDYEWHTIGHSIDNLLLHWILCKGDFIYKQGANCSFYSGTRVCIGESKRGIPPKFYQIKQCLAYSKIILQSNSNLKKNPLFILYYLFIFARIYLSLKKYFLGNIYYFLPQQIKSYWRRYKFLCFSR